MTIRTADLRTICADCLREIPPCAKCEDPEANTTRAHQHHACKEDRRA